MRKPTKDFDHDPRGVTEARVAAGLTKYALAKLLGRSRSLMSEIEGGTRNAQPELLAQMATVLGCPLADLQRKDADEPVAARGGGA